MNAATVETRAESSPDAPPHRRTLLDRALAAIPIVGLALLVFTFYCVEAWTRKTPWIFTDELEWTQISRAIATTGHAARRGEPIYFKSIYPYIIAPAWWLHSTAAGYAAVKYINAFLMPLAAVPTYFLARMLVSRPAAVAVALLSVAIPGMSYASSIVTESIAYPWYALCAWLIVRGLATRRLLDLGLAFAAVCGSTLIRGQLVTVWGSFAIAAAWLWVTGPRGRALRANWSRGDTLGAIVLLSGAVLLFNRVVLHHMQTWQIATEYWKRRMVSLGLQAGAALTVGLAVLPVVGGITSLRLPDRRDDPAYRAFAAYLGASIVCVSLYTAGKAAYLSTVFATLTEERNLIYLSPLLLVGTALVLEARRIEWWLLGVAVAFALFLVATRPLELDYPYFEAPGLAILATANRHLGWDTNDLRIALVAVTGISLVAILLRRLPGAAALTATLLLTWLLAGEISATAGNNSLATQLRNNLPHPLNWVDQDSHGQGVTYLGQQIRDANGIWLTEFWNRSIKHVDSLDGTAPGPGPTLSPNIVTTDGELSNFPGTPYVLADNGIVLQAPVVAKKGTLVLYHVGDNWRMRDAAQGVYADGWVSSASYYTYFVRGGPGTLLIGLSRTGYNGSAPPGHALVRVGSVKINSDASLGIGRLFAVRHVLVPNNVAQVIRVHVPSTPARTEITITPTFVPSASDPRQLGAQVSFGFVPDKRRR